jgi:hypothetical protein
MKIRHLIKHLNRNRKMCRNLFREAAHNVHPTSRKDRNELVTRAYSASSGNTSYHRSLIKERRFNSKLWVFKRKNQQLHASKESKFEINPDGIVMVTHVLNLQRTPWIGMLLLFPERPKNWKPTVTLPHRQGNIHSLTPLHPSPNPTPVL